MPFRNLEPKAVSVVRKRKEMCAFASVSFFIILPIRYILSSPFIFIYLFLSSFRSQNIFYLFSLSLSSFHSLVLSPCSASILPSWLPPTLHTHPSTFPPFSLYFLLSHPASMPLPYAPFIPSILPTSSSSPCLLLSLLPPSPPLCLHLWSNERESTAIFLFYAMIICCGGE